MKTSSIVAAIAVLMSMAFAPADADKTLSVPARVLSPMPIEKPSDDGEEPDERREQLTQYQERRSTRPDKDDYQDATIRFVVPLAERPMLVEAKILVDGQPFQMNREKRIDQLLVELDKPTPKKPVAKSKAESARQNPSDTPVKKNDASDSSNGANIGNEKAAGKKAAEEKATEETPALDQSIGARLRRYAMATNRKPTRNEVRWLLSNWANGPTLLVLSENFQRVRADQTPVLQLLDRDADGVISGAELAQAEKTLLKYDKNQNELLTYNEISAAAQSFVYQRPSQHPATAIPAIRGLGKRVISIWQRTTAVRPLPRSVETLGIKSTRNWPIRL